MRSSGDQKVRRSPIRPWATNFWFLVSRSGFGKIQKSPAKICSRPKWLGWGMLAEQTTPAHFHAWYGSDGGWRVGWRLRQRTGGRQRRRVLSHGRVRNTSGWFLFDQHLIRQMGMCLPFVSHRWHSLSAFQCGKSGILLLTGVWRAWWKIVNMKSAARGKIKRAYTFNQRSGQLVWWARWWTGMIG